MLNEDMSPSNSTTVKSWKKSANVSNNNITNRHSAEGAAVGVNINTGTSPEHQN